MLIRLTIRVYGMHLQHSIICGGDDFTITKHFGKLKVEVIDLLFEEAKCAMLTHMNLVLQVRYKRLNLRRGRFLGGFDHTIFALFLIFCIYLTLFTRKI